MNHPRYILIAGSRQDHLTCVLKVQCTVVPKQRMYIVATHPLHLLFLFQSTDCFVLLGAFISTLRAVHSMQLGKSVPERTVCLGRMSCWSLKTLGADRALYDVSLQLFTLEIIYLQPSMYKAFLEGL